MVLITSIIVGNITLNLYYFYIICLISIVIQRFAPKKSKNCTKKKKSLFRGGIWVNLVYIGPVFDLSFFNDEIKKFTETTKELNGVNYNPYYLH